jgi:ectoine hydroxylase-related dioxygenase (phytanoyl-CoA dioxygenase family)
VVALVGDKVQRLLPDYRILMSHLVTKRAKSQKGTLGLHQDYSFGDHDRSLPLNIWAPLCDVDADNACLRVIAGSPALGHIGAIPPNPSPYDRYRAELSTDFMVELPMRGGDACVFDPRLLHSTGENQTEHDRTALFLNLVPRDEPPLIHVWNREDPFALAVYEITSDILMRLRPNQYPEHLERDGARFVRSIPYRFEETTREAIERLRPVKPSGVRN